MGCARAWWRGLTIKGVVHGEAHPFTQRLEHGDINVGALTGFAAQQQRRQNVGVAVHARGDVCDGVARLARGVAGTGDR